MKSNSTGIKCLCDCGRIKVIRHDSLNFGTSGSKTCGCANIKSKESALYGPAAYQWFMDYKRGAKERNYSFELSIDYFMQLIKQNCHYCNAEPIEVLTKRKLRKSTIANGVDRKDNKQGYTIENSVPCCSTCNKMKLIHPYEDFKEHIAKIAKYMLGLK
jgi:hypothetical protein